MLLAIDIGNTSIHNGIFKGKLLKEAFRIPAHSKDLRAQYVKKLRPYLRKIECVIIVSVVPRVLKKLDGILRALIDGKILVVGKDRDSGVKNLYKEPKALGQDRLVNARAAFELYGGESIIIDLGTAITIDVINKDKEYLGGAIAPGIEISLKALSEKAALLPEAAIKRPKTILGKKTKESMLSGAVYGFSSLCDGIVRRLKKRYCRKGKVILTGGASRIIGPYCETVEKIDPYLTLKGLRLISEANV
ncbi:type III pantothenate kinase [Candidatus Omnitrophota bacterium]